MQSSIYIITPSFNASATIDAAIWSIVSQAGDFTLHYHIQDGGSTDGTVEKVRAWQAKIPLLEDVLGHAIVFSWESAPDKGMYDAIQKGVSRFSMEPDSFMGWCNADDALWPGAVQSITEIGRDLPDVRWLCGWPTRFDNVGRCVNIDKAIRFPQSVLRQGVADGRRWYFLQQESTFWRRSLWDAVGGLNKGLKLVGDWDLWRRFAELTPLAHVQKQLGSFWVRPGQLSSNLDAYISEMETIIPRKCKRDSLSALLRNPGEHLCFLELDKPSPELPWTLSRRTASSAVRRLAKLYAYAPYSGMRRKLLKKIVDRIGKNSLPHDV